VDNYVDMSKNPVDNTKKNEGKPAGEKRGMFTY
jgi:hypothetical protein